MLPLLLLLLQLLLLLLTLLLLLLLGEADPVTSDTVDGMQPFSLSDLDTISLLIPLSVKLLLPFALTLLLLFALQLLLLPLLLLLLLPVGDDALASRALAMQGCSATGSSPDTDCRLLLQLLLLLSWMRSNAVLPMATPDEADG